MTSHSPGIAPARVLVFDTTLRDGEQAPGFSMSVAGKLRMARQLDRLGVDVIEAGFPVASPGDFEAVRTISAAVRRPVIAALARAVPADIRRAAEALTGAARPRIHVFLATSDLHLRVKLRIDRQACLERAVEAVRLACSLCPDVEFSAEDATRSDLAFLCDVADAVVEAGATVVNLPDTVGYALPADVAGMFTAVRARLGGRAVLSAHCHNDLGLAVANTVAAVEAGARQVECTVNGIGERAGNASLEEVAMIFRVRADRLPYDTAVHQSAIGPASRLLARVVDVPVPPNKPIVGANAFAHEAGVHQDGVLKDLRTYEIMQPATLGLPASRLVLGKHSGTRGIDARCRELGYRLGTGELERLYQQLIALADSASALDDTSLHRLVTELRGRGGSGPAGSEACA